MSKYLKYKDIIQAEDKLSECDFSQFESIKDILSHEWSLPERVVLAKGCVVEDKRQGFFFQTPSTKECLEYDIEKELENDRVHAGIVIRVRSHETVVNDKGFYLETVTREIHSGSYEKSSKCVYCGSELMANGRCSNLMCEYSKEE